MLVPRHLLPILCGLLLSGLARGQPKDLDLAPLEKVVTEEMKAGGIPGVVVVIVQGERVSYAKGFGVASVETSEPVTAEHLFRVGSTTKMFVGTTLARLAAAGKVDLRQPISKVIDGLPPRLAALTPHQLLTHTAGLGDEAPWYGRQDEEALGDGIKKWQETRLVNKPGEIYAYSNPGYWLAGYLAERAAGKPFADVVAEEVFQPLGMNHTTFRPTVAMTFPLAQGHERKDGKPVIIRPAANNAATWPAGSMYTSGQDLSRFVIAFLNGGKLGSEQALPEAVFNMISTPYVKMPGGKTGYGYGLMLTTHHGVETAVHGGARSGYGSYMLLAPSRKVGVILLGNRTAAALPKSLEKAAELLLK